MWQELFEKYGSEDFTVVGLALDAEGIAPAKLYYERFGVSFPALVDPDYATRFGAVPKTFFVDEHGSALELKNWKTRLAQLGKTKPVTDAIRSLWSTPGTRLDSAAIAELTEANSQHPNDLVIATQLGSRYTALGLEKQSRIVLQRAVGHHDAKAIAQAGGRVAELLGQAYFQLARAFKDSRASQVRFATLSFYINPSVGFGKQIARIIAPEKFDGRAAGDFDNRFREGTLRRLTRERKQWLTD